MTSVAQCARLEVDKSREKLDLKTRRSYLRRQQFFPHSVTCIIYSNSFPRGLALFFLPFTRSPLRPLLCPRRFVHQCTPLCLYIVHLSLYLDL